MEGLEIRPFSEEYLADAGALLAARHERHVAARPLLSMGHDFRGEVEELWRREGASGCVALADGQLVGYLLGWPRSADRWGQNAWVEAAGHAAADPEVVRDLYGRAAGDWVDRGNVAHFVLVPATDDGLLESWFRLGFGIQSANGIRALTDVDATSSSDIRIREATEADLDALVALSPVLRDHHGASPVFSRSRRHSAAEIRTYIAEDVAAADVGDLVAELDGRIVGTFVVRPVDGSETHAGLASPPNAALLAFAVTDPHVRGSGAGVALTNAALAWARNRGYETMVVDWRETNLLSSRFWPRRGFERTFLRLHRFIG